MERILARNNDRAKAVLYPEVSLCPGGAHVAHPSRIKTVSWRRWIVYALALTAFLLLTLPRVMPLYHLQRLYNATEPKGTASANSVVIDGHKFELITQSETPWYMHPGDSKQVHLWVHRKDDDAPLSASISPTLLKAATCHIFAPAFVTTKVNGPWMPNSGDLNCDWAVWTDRIGSQALLLQVTIGEQNITQEAEFEVGLDPLDPTFLTTLLGVATALATVLQLLLADRKRPDNNAGASQT